MPSFLENVTNRAPNANDDAAAGWFVSCRWLDTVAEKEWRCVSNANGAAVWRGIGMTNGGGVIPSEMLPAIAGPQGNPGVAGRSVLVTSSATPPANPVVGDVWLVT